MNRPGPIVEVDWEDSTGHGHWHEPDAAHKLRTQLSCRTVGYLIHEDDHSVTISMGIGGMGHFLHSMAIPRAAIQKITKR